MEFNIIINQAALRPWIKNRKIDMDDAAIVAFIRKLSPNDPRVKKYMVGSRYRVQRSWILAELPLLRFGEDRLSRRLHALAKLGIVDLKAIVDRNKQFTLYAKLTPEYFRQENKAREDLEILARDHHGENTHGRAVPTPTVKTPSDHKKNDQGGGDAAALPKGADGVPTPRLTKEQTQELFRAATGRAKGATA